MTVPTERSRAYVALGLALSVGLCVLMLTGAALVDAISRPGETKVTPAYVALIQTTLGVLVGGLVGYLGGAAGATKKSEVTP